jgi:regulator-associated protein of mTOR
MTALTVHRHAPVMASGSAKQYIKVFSMVGEQLSMVRYHNSFLGQRIGPVSCLQFHPYQVLLAAGATDSIVSIYAGESQRSR